MKNLNTISKTTNWKSFAKFFFALFSMFILAFGGMALISIGNKSTKEADAYYTSPVVTDRTSPATPSGFLPSGSTAILSADWAERLFNALAYSLGSYNSWDSQDGFYRQNISKIVFTKDIATTLKNYYPSDNSSYGTADNSRAKLYHYTTTTSPAVVDPDTGTVITPAKTTYSFYTHYVVVNVGYSTSAAVKAYLFYNDFSSKSSSATTSKNYTVFIASNGVNIQVQSNAFGIDEYTTDSGYNFTASDVRDYYYAYTGFYPDSYYEGMNQTHKHHWFSNLQEINFNSCVVPYSANSYQYLFAGCGKLTTLTNPGSLFSFTSTHKNLTGMFYYCESLTSIPTLGITSSQTNLSRLFEGCSGLTSLNLSSWFVNGITDFSFIFDNCHGLTAVPTGVVNWDISSATTLAGMFKDCRGITSFDSLINDGSKNFIAKMKTNANVSQLFYDCAGVTTIDLTTLLGRLSSSSAQVRYMIGGMTGITSISGLSSFYLYSNVSGLFINWDQITTSNITTLLNGFNTQNATSMAQLFAGCEGLTSISDVMKLPYLDMKNVTDIQLIFQGCHFTNINYFQPFITNYKYDGGTLSLRSAKTTPITNMAGVFRDTDITAISDAHLDHDSSGRTTFSWKPTNTSQMFMECDKLTSLNGISIIDTTNTTSMTEMFRSSGITSLDYLSQLKFNACTNTSYMFAYSKVTTLSSNSATISATNVTDMSYMFYSCSSLTSIGDFSYFNCSNATDMNNMFAYSKLENLNGLSSLKMDKATNAFRMFMGCSSLTKVSDNTASGTKATSLTNIQQMFAASNVTSLANMIKLDLSKVTNASYMFQSCSSLSNITGLSSVALTNSSAVDASYMFYNCTSLQYLDSDTSGEEVNFSGVTNISYMFSESGVKSLSNMIKFKTPKVTNASYMFYKCNYLTSIAGLSSLPLTSTSGVNASYMFAECVSTSFKTADFSSGTIDFSGVTNMSNMFYNTANLNKVTFPAASGYFKTDKLTNTSYMFRNTKLATMENLEYFDTDKVTNMSYMFNGCDFVTFDASRLHTESVTTMYEMFWACNLMTEITFKTASFNNFKTDKVTNMKWMFETCSKLVNLDLTCFDTSNVTDITAMFTGCTKLESVDLSSFNLSKVSSYGSVFYNCVALKEVYTPLTLKSGVSLSLPKTLCNEKTGETTNTITADHLSVSASDKTRLAIFSSISYTSDDIDNVTNTNQVAYCFSPNQQTIVLTDPTRPNYKFAGWTLKSTGTGHSYDAATKTLTINANCEDAIELEMNWDQDILTLYAMVPGGNVTDATFPDGSTQTTIITAYGNTYGILPEPTSANYTFLGWWDGSDPTSFVSKEDIASTNVTVDGDHTLYAMWEGKTITITLDVNGGDSLASSTVPVKYGETYPTPALPTPIRANHIFLGWFDSAVGGTKFEKDGQTVTETADFTLFAQWQIAEITVSFDTNGGNALNDTVTVIYGSYYSTLPTPTKTGFDFEGWYQDMADMADPSNKVTTSTVVTQMTDHTLYANWTAQGFTLTFMTPSEDSVGNSIYGSIILAETMRSITFGEAFGAVFPTCSLLGYTFDGWYYDTDFTSLALNTDTLNDAESKTLYAKLIPDNVSIAFEGYAFDTNGNALIDTFTFTNQTQTKTYGSLMSVPTINNLAGYTFGGWYEDINDENTKLTNNRVTFNTDKTYITKWIINNYTVTISVNDNSLGSVSPTTVTKPYYSTLSSAGNVLTIGDATVTATSAIITGYTVTFNGWSTFNSPLTEDCSITATFSKTPISVTLSFNANTTDNYGAALLDTPTIATNSLTFDYDATISNLPEPSFSVTPVGYTFLGWFTEAGAKVENGNIMHFTTNTNIVAQWQIKEYSFTLTTEGEGGTIDKAAITAKYKQNIALDADNKILNIGAEAVTATLEVNAGYDIDFVGYYLDGSLISSSIVINDNTATNITAKFSKVARTFTVTFYPGDGNFIGSDAGQTSIVRSFTFDQTYVNIPAADKTGYNFIGFFTSDKSIQVAEGQPVQITSNVEVFADFSLEMFSVTILVDGAVFGNIDGQTSISISDIGYGTVASLSGDILTINGVNYTANKNNQTGFTVSIDWLADGVSFTASGSHTIVKTTTITAKFSRSADVYKLSFNLNTVDSDGDNLLTSHPLTYPDVEITYNGSYPTLPSPTLEGYSFQSWRLGGATITSGTLVQTTGDQTLVAVWKINTFKVTISSNNTAIGTVSKGAVVNVEFGTKISVSGNQLSIGTENILAQTKPDTTGYTNSFEKWIQKATGQPDLDPFVTEISMPNAQITIIANFTREANEYTVDFDPDGGSYVAPFSVIFDSSYGITLNTEPTKTGYDFAGWYLGASRITADTRVSTASNHTLTAHWTIMRFNISFSLNNDGGMLSQTNAITVDWNTMVTVSGSTITIHSTPSQTITASAKSIEGYTTSFQNWTIDGTIFSTSKNIDNSINITANFNKNAISFIVGFNSVSENPVHQTKSILYGESYGELPVPTKFGHNFTGWYATSDYSTNQVFSTTQLKTTNPTMTLWAKWSPKTIIVSFAVNTKDDLSKELYGTPALNGNLTKTYKFTDEYSTLPTPTLVGYTFQYWQTAGGQAISSYTTMVDEKDHELSAVWVANNYNIVFETNGGSEIESKTIKFNTPYGTLADTEKRGHIFLGWYSNASCSDGNEVTSETILLDENKVTLYAKWETIKYRITITSNDESLGYVNIAELKTIPFGSQILTNNRLLTILNNEIVANVIIRYGYNVTFTGWTVNDSKLSVSTVEGDMAIQANFTIAPKTVYIYLVVDTKDTFGMRLEGVPKLETPLNFSTTFGKNLYEQISEPTLNGYTFCGWYLDKNYTKKLQTDTIVDMEEQMTLYAKWEQIIEPINATEIIIYVSLGVLAVGVIVTVVIILRKQKEKDNFNMGNKQ